MLVETRGVAVVGGVFRIFEPFDLRMGDQNDHHSALVAQFLKQVDDLAPVSQRMGISPAVAAVGFFDGTDTEFAADLVEDEALEPVNGIHNDGLELVSFVPERGQFCDYLGKRMCKREFPAVDFAESVFRLDEDRIWCSGCITALPYTFTAVNHDARRLVFPPGLNVVKHSHNLFPSSFQQFANSI